jgi:fibronectin-binding autotransporter adhesin
VLSGGIASNTIVSSGGSLVISSGGLADPSIIYAGGSETVSSGGTDLGAYVSGGLQIDLGLVTGVTVYASPARPPVASGLGAVAPLAARLVAESCLSAHDTFQ